MKYTLIQTYPGYETLGITHCSENKTPDWRGMNFYDAHPKYWQKVEEVDYEILSFVAFGTTLKKDSQLKDTFCERDGFSPFFSLKNLTKTTNAKIFSVKRLSDGAVFNIGDEISTGHFTKNAKINRIAITTINYQLQGIWVSYKGGSCALSGITKVNKTPLFTTEDGIEIFKGDKFSVVQLSTFHQINNCSYPLTNAIDWKCFSTKEEAKEYIIFNKSILSLNDIGTVLSTTSPLFNNIKELAKSKL